MTLLVLGIALRRIGIGAACIATLLLCAGAGQRFDATSRAQSDALERNLRFLHSAAGIQGRLQALRVFERKMLAHAVRPERADFYRRKHDSARHRIDELAGAARASAIRPEDRSRVDMLARLIAGADARFDTVLLQLNYGEIR